MTVLPSSPNRPHQLSNQTPNLPRSFAALIVGNVIAILVSSVISLLICQTFFPDFFQAFLERGRAVKELKKWEEDHPNKQQDTNGDGEQKLKDKTTGNQSAESIDEARSKLKEKAEAKIDFPVGCAVAFFVCDILFAALAGCVCVWVANSSKFNHAVLLALLIGVFKFQAVLGFVENQLPKTLLMLELVCAPLACILGASFQFENIERQENNGPDEGFDRAFESENPSDS